MKNLIQFKLFHKMVQLGKYNIIAGNIITVGLVDSRMDFEADTVRFGQTWNPQVGFGISFGHLSRLNCSYGHQLSGKNMRI
jgi:hypothetical protein